MRLTLYHNDKEPQVLLSVIKIDINDDRTLTVKSKPKKLIECLTYSFERHYHRLTIQVD